MTTETSDPIDLYSLVLFSTHNNTLDWRHTAFNWENYLRVNRAEAIPHDVFHTRNPKPFQTGMALEVVDRKNPTLIRPAIITEIYEYDIKVLYIGWPDEYAYWIPDDSTDIYPPGWCKRTNHPIEFPIGKCHHFTIIFFLFIYSLRVSHPKPFDIFN